MRITPLQHHHLPPRKIFRFSRIPRFKMSGKPYLEQPDLHNKAPFRSALLTYPGNLRQALKDAQEDPSKTLVGVAHGIPSTFVTKLLASAKPDFVWIDVEHGMFNRLELHE